jgi:hypothetical protein
MRDIDGVIAKNKEVGGTFFNNRTVLYFKSKVLPTMYGDKFFISYDVDETGTKAYVIREVLESGRIRHAEDRGMVYSTKSQAVNAIRLLLNETANV